MKKKNEGIVNKMVGAIIEKKQWLKNHLRNRKTKERN